MSTELLNERDRLKEKLKSSRKINLFFGFLLTTSIASNIVLSQQHTTAIVPTGLKQTFMIKNGVVDSAGLQEMAYYIMSLAENQTPESVDYLNSKLLELTTPDDRAALSNALDKKAKEIKRNRLSSSFSVSDVSVNLGSGMVRVRGVKRVWVDKEPVTPKNETYVIGFTYQAGRLRLKYIKDITKR